MMEFWEYVTHILAHNLWVNWYFLLQFFGSVLRTGTIYFSQVRYIPPTPPPSSIPCMFNVAVLIVCLSIFPLFRRRRKVNNYLKYIDSANFTEYGNIRLAHVLQPLQTKRNENNTIGYFFNCYKFKFVKFSKKYKVWA